MKGLTHHAIVLLAAAWASLTSASQSIAQQSAPSATPNILVIMGDDIGYWNLSVYNRGQMS
jgi:hypothetical protein